MVSLRRRKHLGFCNGVENSILTLEDATTHSSNSVHPIPLYDLNIRAEDENDTSGEIGPSNVGSNHSYDQNNQPNTFGSTLAKEMNCQPITEVKQRKQQRRRKGNNQEHGSNLRGVYFKNMKWQAAIKVDKKQIHLGTFSSRKEAANLYDRAAHMCGREPNFELTEAEKQELSKLNWDEFMAMTRNAITNKRSRRVRAI